MHETSYDAMMMLLDKHADRTAFLRVLDVGSMVAGSTYPPGTPIVGGTYRALCPSPWSYTGLDIAPGPNVDLVASDPYHWPVEDRAFDLVISGQCLEHVPEPWTWMDEIARVCRGMCVIIAPSGGPCHRYPVDCWRIFPDGMEHLLRRSGFEIVKVDTKYLSPGHWNDCWGVGRKPHG